MCYTYKLNTVHVIVSLKPLITLSNANRISHGPYAASQNGRSTCTYPYNIKMCHWKCVNDISGLLGLKTF